MHPVSRAVHEFGNLWDSPNVSSWSDLPPHFAEASALQFPELSLKEVNISSIIGSSSDRSVG
jgi:hypothetical protein